MIVILQTNKPFGNSTMFMILLKSFLFYTELQNFDQFDVQRHHRFISIREIEDDVLDIKANIYYG